MDISERLGRKVESKIFGDCTKYGGLDEILRVTLEKDFMDVTILEPRERELPFPKLIAATLNCALIQRFNLRPYFDDSNMGVCGVVDSKPWAYITLIDKPELLGLQVKEPITSLFATPVLDFYHGLLKRLFLEPVNFAEFQYRAGEILRGSGAEITREHVLFHLAAALTSIGGQEFREAVFYNLERNFPLTLEF